MIPAGDPPPPQKRQAVSASSDVSLHLVDISSHWVPVFRQDSSFWSKSVWQGALHENASTRHDICTATKHYLPFLSFSPPPPRTLSLLILNSTLAINTTYRSGGSWEGGGGGGDNQPHHSFGDIIIAHSSSTPTYAKKPKQNKTTKPA